MSIRCQILLPGLFDLPLAELPNELLDRQLPNLNRLLRFARPLGNRNYSIDAMLAAALGWSQASTAGLPLAQAFAADEEGDHLLVEAVHLHPDLHNAILVPIEKSDENIKDIGILINDLSDLFKVDCDLTAITDSVYLMRLESLVAPCFYPHLLSVLGKPANPYVEQSREHLPWYRLLNEIQMYLYQHPVNQRRQAQGMLPINSLWCWGGGPARSVRGHYNWYCEDMILNRFAESLGLQPRSIDDLAGPNDARHSVIIDLRLLEATKLGQAVDLAELLLDIEQRIFAVLVGKPGTTVRVCCASEFDFQMQAWSSLKFWCRTNNLQDWQNRLHSSATQYS